MGYTGEVEHPEVVRAIETVENARKQANVKLGYVDVNTTGGAAAAFARPYIERGLTLITAGVGSLCCSTLHNGCSKN